MAAGGRRQRRRVTATRGHPHPPLRWNPPLSGWTVNDTADMSRGVCELCMRNCSGAGLTKEKNMKDFFMDNRLLFKAASFISHRKGVRESSFKLCVKLAGPTSGHRGQRLNTSE